jgi:hypothetical protein
MLGIQIAITGGIVLALWVVAIAQISFGRACRMSNARAGLVLLPGIVAAAAVVGGILMAVWSV